MLTRIGNAQNRVLAQVLVDQRLNFLLEGEATAKNPDDVYTLAEMLDDLQRGVWSELERSGAEDRSVPAHATEQLSHAR